MKCWWRPMSSAEMWSIGHMDRICKSQQHEEAKASTKQHQEEQFLLQHASQQWCTNHMTNDQELFKELDKTIISKVKIGNGEFISLRKNHQNSSLGGVYMMFYMCDIDQNRLVLDMIEKGFKFIFEDKWCMIKDAKGRDVFKVKIRAKSFALNLMEDEQIAFSSLKLEDPSSNSMESNAQAAMVHTDVGGPQKTPSLNGSKYYIAFIDDYTRFCWIYFLKSKSEVKRDKLDKKAEPGVFIGYSNSSKAYKIFQPQNGKILVSRDVKFMEDKQWNWEESIKMQAPEAEKDDKWIEAMKEELRMIEKNDTWELVDRPQHRKVIGVKWVYRTKLNADGSINKYKARLVVKGYSQVFGVDFSETFAPVARLDTIRTLLALTKTKGMESLPIGCKICFLNGYLQEEIYVEQLEGFQVKG
ncbi:hypothetical protein AAG906_011771 [Vitis piasezkii]